MHSLIVFKLLLVTIWSGRISSVPLLFLATWAIKPLLLKQVTAHIEYAIIKYKTFNLNVWIIILIQLYHGNHNGLERVRKSEFQLRPFMGHKISYVPPEHLLFFILLISFIGKIRIWCKKSSFRSSISYTKPKLYSWQC